MAPSFSGEDTPHCICNVSSFGRSIPALAAGQTLHTVLLINLANPGTAAHPLRSGRPRHRQPRSVPLWESLVSHPMSRGAGIRSSRCPRLRKVVADSALAPHRRAERARCFQVIQTGTTTLRIRLDAEPGAIEARVWMELASRLRTYLAPQRIADMTREGASERPAPHPTSDKFRHV